MCKNDISTSHCLQSRNGATPLLILVRVVRGEKKVEIMRAKKNLKAKSKGVCIDKDLTPHRPRMFHDLRNDDALGAVRTIDGKLRSKASINGEEQKVVINSSDGLFKLGRTEEKMKPSMTRKAMGPARTARKKGIPLKTL